MTFDTIAIVDWSGGNDTGARARKDAIWACAVGAGACAPTYLRNRDAAFDWLFALGTATVSNGQRALIGFDFPFGYPAGFAGRLGVSGPLDLWDFLARNLEDTPRRNSRFALAGALNRRFPGVGPFWFNGGKADVPDLPRKGLARHDHGMAERRLAETRAKGTFTCWQMGGAGSVGSQAMTGMAHLARLRAALKDRVRVWPFEPLNREVALVEIWPSLIDDAVRNAQRPDEPRDAAQVRVLAATLWEMQLAGDLTAALNDVPEIARREEGWILGLGHQTTLSKGAERIPDVAVGQ
ncbi:molybdopterin guanine dinucleotide synthesis [Oceaniglobus ichthyenteri]|uniref:molybdopterin guanine dinucleotide synthesis n=1 Tax=Oceaniglobus ichthyenteri TaxID=2136177 RepID=UPI001F0BBC3B|nr:molybdopterin guanine dinucleotide synthesis [Oceaniglobus ichthyenteri]